MNPSLTMPNSVGGIPSGTSVADLNGDSLKDILNDMLFPTVNPTYEDENNIFVENADLFYEVGAIFNISFTATFDRGRILVSNNYQDDLAGPPNSFFYTDPSANTLLVDVSTSISPNIQVISNYKALLGVNSWTNRIAYDQGPQPYDNKGNPKDNPLPAGITAIKTVSFEGVYPIFATTNNINTLTKQSLISMSVSQTPEYNLVAETGGGKQAFQISNKWTGIPNSKPLIGIETYNSFSGQWEYQGGNAPASLLAWTTTSDTQIIQGVSENYTQYTYNRPDRSSIRIRLRF
ncbi:MAG: hypothetical protein HC831_11710 [Chloroflexia bacterium]|nr:hypothetical protein [Chloroflexia bacterium]